MSIVIWLLTFVLVLLSIFLVLIVLAQKSKSDGGVGAALGGGMTEATFGADTGNVLATLTRNGAIAFFVICFGLYLAHIARHSAAKSAGALPTIEAPAAPAATPAPAASDAVTPAPATDTSTVPAPAVIAPAATATPVEGAANTPAPVVAPAAEPAK
jgi:preprotein translocase subunit SecG